MVDITYTGNSTERRAHAGAVTGQGLAYSKKSIVTTVEVASATAAGSTYKVARIPSNARISMSSHAYWDDLSTATTTMDIGLASVNANVTSDADALANGLDVASAGDNRLIAAIAEGGKPAWDHINGQTSDPGGELDVYVSLLDALHSITGTLTVELDYVVD